MPDYSLYIPKDHGGNMDKEQMDVVSAVNDLVAVHMKIESGQLVGASDVIEVYNERLICEALDYGKKRRLQEEARVNQLFIGEGGLVCSGV